MSSKKFNFFPLLLLFSYIKFILTDIKTCGKTDPEYGEHCYSNIVYDSEKACCYLEYKPRGANKVKKMCLEIKTPDLEDEDTFKSIIRNLPEDLRKYDMENEEAGDDDNDEEEESNNSLREVLEINCFGGEPEYSMDSCMKKTNVRSSNDCFYENIDGKKNQPTDCCYLIGKNKDDSKFVQQCVQINETDKNDLVTAKDKISKGTYWNDITYGISDIKDLICEPRSSCEGVINPKEFKDCDGKETNENDSECCYFYGELKNQGDNAKQCVPIKRSDAVSYENLGIVQKKIMDGMYWENNPVKFGVVKELDCKNAYYVQSACEATLFPSPLSCKGKATETPFETCCYLKAKILGEDYEEAECVDISKDDTEDLEKTKELIQKGEYWKFYDYKYEVVSVFDCYERGKLIFSYSNLVKLCKIKIFLYIIALLFI